MKGTESGKHFINSCYRRWCACALQRDSQAVTSTCDASGTFFHVDVKQQRPQGVSLYFLFVSGWDIFLFMDCGGDKFLFRNVSQLRVQ